METNYESPQIEVIEVEVEDTFCQSAFEDMEKGDSWGNRRIYIS